ncbi:MAG TPA: MOSC domain-containing protein [Gemmatimonadales bacterium]|jgi:MOSC domain-containing protein YiiM|nr:MOSC domain-containing protein [Gemmatimonadales bacterium]
MSPSTGVLEAIWIKRATRGPMDPADRATLVAGRGIRGNADQGGKRQVTIIAREAFDAIRATLGPAAGPAMRRANLLVSGVPLAESRGRTLRVGGARIRVHGETRPCYLMDDALPGLQAALRPEWRGGVFGEVLDDGEIRVGDAVRWEDS